MISGEQATASLRPSPAQLIAVIGAGWGKSATTPPVRQSRISTL